MPNTYCGRGIAIAVGTMVSERKGLTLGEIGGVATVVKALVIRTKCLTPSVVYRGISDGVGTVVRRRVLNTCCVAEMLLLMPTQWCSRGGVPTPLWSVEGPS